jgi:hypothetical protein
MCPCQNPSLLENHFCCTPDQRCPLQLGAGRSVAVARMNSRDSARLQRGAISVLRLSRRVPGPWLHELFESAPACERRAACCQAHHLICPCAHTLATRMRVPTPAHAPLFHGCILRACRNATPWSVGTAPAPARQACRPRARCVGARAACQRTCVKTCGLPCAASRDAAAMRARTRPAAVAAGLPQGCPQRGRVMAALRGRAASALAEKQRGALRRRGPRGLLMERGTKEGRRWGFLFRGRDCVPSSLVPHDKLATRSRNRRGGARPPHLGSCRLGWSEPHANIARPPGLRCVVHACHCRAERYVHNRSDRTELRPSTGAARPACCKLFARRRAPLPPSKVSPRTHAHSCVAGPPAARAASLCFILPAWALLTLPSLCST